MHILNNGGPLAQPKIITDKKCVVLKETNLNTKGKGSINVDASTLATGAYQYSVYVNNKLIDTKQMMLSRKTQNKFLFKGICKSDFLKFFQHKSNCLSS